MIRWLEKQYWVSFSITVFLALFIYAISAKTFTGSPGATGNWLAVFYHFFIYYFFTIFLLITIIQGKHKNMRLLLWTILLAVGYAISDEYHQLFVIGRYASLADILLDSGGIFLASTLYQYGMMKE